MKINKIRIVFLKVFDIIILEPPGFESHDNFYSGKNRILVSECVKCMQNSYKKKVEKLQNWFDACKSMKSAINMTDHMGDNFDRVGDLPLTDWYLWFEWNAVM